MADDLIPHKTWISRTEVSMQRRSAELKALDQLLADYEARGGGDLRWRVGQALQAWKATHGNGDEWRKSSRNRNGAVDDLTRALAAKHTLSEADEAALAAVAEANKAFLGALFAERRVVLSARALTAYQGLDLAHDLDRLVAQARSGDSGTSVLMGEAHGLIQSLLGDVWHLGELQVLVAQVLGRGTSELASSIAPGLGLIKSASMTMYHSVMLMANARKVIRLEAAEPAIAPGDPAAALLAVQELAKRETAHSAARLASYAAETGGKLIGTFVDGGTATAVVAGTAATIARMLVTLNAIRIDVLEMRAANELLEKPDTLDATLFAKNPLLGCYFLACADTSTIVNFMFKDLGKPGFQYEVEKACKDHLDATVKIANHLVYDHRMKLSGRQLPKMSVMRGDDKDQIAVRDPGTVMQIKAAATNRVRGRDGGFFK